MMKKTLLSAIFISSISLAVAQDAAKESTSAPVKLNQTSPYKIIDNKPIIVKGEAVIVKEERTKKNEQPKTKQKQAKAVIKPTPQEGTTDTNK
ncbi:MAG: hypothetical protein JKY52_08205 [Flavobacteriales bacterium]|nr:hypothetical protein [Flavobacteriales bacterium]